jgi:hypothetical protein
MFFPDRLSKMFHDLIAHRRRITSCTASRTLNQSLSLSIPRFRQKRKRSRSRPGNRIAIFDRLLGTPEQALACVSPWNSGIRQPLRWQLSNKSMYVAERLKFQIASRR